MLSQENDNLPHFLSYYKESRVLSYLHSLIFFISFEIVFYCFLLVLFFKMWLILFFFFCLPLLLIIYKLKIKKHSLCHSLLFQSNVQHTSTLSAYLPPSPLPWGQKFKKKNHNYKLVIPIILFYLCISFIKAVFRLKSII